VGKMPPWPRQHSPHCWHWNTYRICSGSDMEVLPNSGKMSFNRDSYKTKLFLL
jgi:hypothetical protein